MPFPGIGTAAHAHISLNATEPNIDVASASESFASAILTHLPAICAITMPQPVSYNRVVDDSWTGGTWVAWGSNNREVPLRRVTSIRWEIRCLDGTSNMYLAMATILAAGLSGVQQGSPLTLKDCHRNPTKFSAQEKMDLGIVSRMRRDFEEAMMAFEADEELQNLVGQDLATTWIAVKRAEQDMLNEKTEDEKRRWLIELY